MTSSHQQGRRSSSLVVELMEDRITPTVGVIDPTFGSDGIASAPFPFYGPSNPVSTVYAEAVQKNGDIVVVGRADSQFAANPYNLDFGVARFTEDGVLDTTFGNNGLVLIPFNLNAANPNQNNDIAGAVGITSTGNIVVGGTVDVAGGTDIGLAELNTNGSIDTAFGKNGLVAENVTNQPIINDNTVNGLAIQPDGKIITVGSGSLAGATGMEIVRFNPNGTLDTTFNGTGSLVFDPSTGLDDVANAVTLQSNGQIVIAGTVQAPGAAGTDMAVIRLNSNGTQDTTFGTTIIQPAGTIDKGIFTAGFSQTGGGTGTALTIQPNGQIVVVGSGHIGQGDPSGFAVVRLNPNGTFDQTFGFTAGKEVLNFQLGGTNDCSASGVVLETNGDIVVGGNVAIPNGDTGFGIFRLVATGTLDLSFGTNGFTSYDTGVQSSVNFPAMANALALGKDGRFLLAGGGSTGMVVVGFTGDGGTGVSGVTGPGNLGYGNGLLAASTDGAQLTAYGVNASTGSYTISLSVNLADVFPGYTGPVRSAVADVNGDGIPDFVVVTGPGTPTEFAVINGSDQTSFIVPPTPAFPGSASFTGGAFVSVGAFGRGQGEDWVLTPDQGGGPRVVIYDYANGGAEVAANFFGINAPTFRGGARSAVGDINGDGIADLVVAAGYGGGPRIAVWNGATLFSSAPTELMNDFFAFSPFLNNGAYVAVGDVNGDGYGDIVFGAGEGGAPQVLIISGQTLLSKGAIYAIANPLANFYLNGDTTSRGGARVATKNVDGDNKIDVVAASGAGDPALIKVYAGSAIGGAGEPYSIQTLTPFGGATLTDGVYVG
jgi:uncharacterized delta-60 repeat protein